MSTTIGIGERRSTDPAVPVSQVPLEVALAVERADASARGAERPVGSLSATTGERRLLVAILGDALLQVVRPREIQDREQARRVARSSREAREWIFSDDRSFLFSFLPLCDLLGLDPDYLRALVRSRIETIDPAAPPRRRGRRRGR